MRITTKLEYKDSRGTRHRISASQRGKLAKLVQKDLERAIKQALRKVRMR